MQRTVFDYTMDYERLFETSDFFHEHSAWINGFVKFRDVLNWFDNASHLFYFFSILFK